MLVALFAGKMRACEVQIERDKKSGAANAHRGVCSLFRFFYKCRLFAECCSCSRWNMYLFGGVSMPLHHPVAGFVRRLILAETLFKSCNWRAAPLCDILYLIERGGNFGRATGRRDEVRHFLFAVHDILFLHSGHGSGRARDRLSRRAHERTEGAAKAVGESGSSSADDTGALVFRRDPRGAAARAEEHPRFVGCGLFPRGQQERQGAEDDCAARCH